MRVIFTNNTSLLQTRVPLGPVGPLNPARPPRPYNQQNLATIYL